ncbi:class I SAM-dependent methyltransferase [Nocardiopsis sp. LOL_012]|uniref:class I SAM-dependent methyltransferase n=1 Tax=Nocardiopsis sp. LOL_012 TaxID=3345409 RepID=UPI003A8606B9
MYDADFWENHYRALDPEWGTTPNEATVSTIRTLFTEPGHALELGAGHGGDALWLADEKWTVTALDVAQTAVDRIAARAAGRGLSNRVRAAQWDATVQAVPTGPFDLVLSSFFYAPDRNDIWRHAAETVKPGGALVIIDHGSSAPWSWSTRSHVHPTPTRLAQAPGLGPAWSTALLDSATRKANGPGGQQAEVIDTIVAMRREDSR